LKRLGKLVFLTIVNNNLTDEDKQTLKRIVRDKCNIFTDVGETAL